MDILVLFSAQYPQEFRDLNVVKLRLTTEKGKVKTNVRKFSD